MIFAADFGESFILEIVAVVIVAVIIWRKFPIPFLRDAMNKQREAIGAQLAAGDAARAATEQLVKQRRDELAAAKDEAAAIVEQARRSASLLVEDGERRADAEYERLVAHAGTQIELERLRMRDDVMAEMSSAVIVGAHRLVDAELDAPRHRALIDESIASVESEVNA